MMKNVSSDTVWGEKMKKPTAREIAELLKKSRIFCGVSEKNLLSEAEKAEIRIYEKGEFIAKAGSRQGFIGVILGGRAEVGGGERLRISILERGDIFGAVTLFGSGGFQRDITALCRCSVLILSREAVGRILTAEPKTAQDYIGYLSDRIGFLNRRIEAFTGDNPGIRLAEWLLDSSEGESLLLPVSLTSLAGFLNISRASLYRAFEALESENLVRRNGRQVEITSRKALAEYSHPDVSE